MKKTRWIKCPNCNRQFPRPKDRGRALYSCTCGHYRELNSYINLSYFPKKAHN